MKCPACNETLVMTDRQGVEIDYCPACRGVWLDRGELDKIIERSAAYEAQTPPAPPPPQQQQPYYKQEGHKHPYDPHYGHHKKKKGFLGDFFDFD
jgi:hypothetical protein